MSERAEIISRAKRIVVKLGTATLMNDDGDIALSRFYGFVEQLVRLKKNGREVLLVTSGAVGLGRKTMQAVLDPRDNQALPIKQACAAIGQGRLMSLYCDAFERLGVVAAQVLLTESDFTNRKRYLNLRTTLNKLIELGALPIINENDTVSTDELEMLKNAPDLKVNFGDNDKLSALVASKIEADLLIILTDVDGIYDADPTVNNQARLYAKLDAGGAEIEELLKDNVKAAGAAPASGTKKPGRGGIKTKLSAARVAASTGCATIIACGKQPDILDRLLADQEKILGTLIMPNRSLKGKARWIAFATTTRAVVVINAGARAALTQGKKSLLPAGVIEVRGDFDRGDVVVVHDQDGVEIGRGMVNYSSDEARKISGKHSDEIAHLVVDHHYDALITRDNFVSLGDK